MTVADPDPLTVVPAALAIVIVNSSLFGTVTTWNGLVVKSDAEYPAPDGGVTELNKKISPGSKACAALLTVTVAEVFTVSKVQLVKAVPKGVISKKAPS